MTNFTDTLTAGIGAKGTLSVNIINKSGEIVEAFTEHNLVVQTSNLILTGLMGGDLGVIDRICVGNDSTAETLDDTTISTIDTTTIALEDTIVGGAPVVFTQLMTSHEYPETNIVKFVWEIGYNEANGIDIAEYGLCNTEGMMFSRKVRGRIEKTQDLSLQGTWTIEFLPIEA